MVRGALPASPRACSFVQLFRTTPAPHRGSAARGNRLPYLGDRLAASALAQRRQTVHRLDRAQHRVVVDRPIVLPWTDGAAEEHRRDLVACPAIVLVEGDDEQRVIALAPYGIGAELAAEPAIPLAPSAMDPSCMSCPRLGTTKLTVGKRLKSVGNSLIGAAKPAFATKDAHGLCLRGEAGSTKAMKLLPARYSSVASVGASMTWMKLSATPQVEPL